MSLLENERKLTVHDLDMHFTFTTFHKVLKNDYLCHNKIIPFQATFDILHISFYKICVQGLCNS